MSDHIYHIAKTTADTTAAIVSAGALMQWLPPLAALFTILWTGLRMFEWFEKRFMPEKVEARRRYKRTRKRIK